MTHTPRLTVLLAIAVCVAAVLGAAPAASASTFTVTRTDDRASGSCTPGDCSLREAIIAANQNAGPDQIVLGTGQVYALTLGPADVTPTALTPASGDLDVTDSVVIDGHGSIIDATGLLDRVMQIDGGTVVLNDLTISGGGATGFLSLGGGLFIHNATVTLSNSTVTGNSTLIESGASDDGGGIAVLGSFSAGVTTVAHLTLDRTTVTNNSGLNGGGLLCVLCDLTVINGSVISSNNASGGDGGGGLDVVGDASTVSVTQSTVVSNTATRGGAAAMPVGASTSTFAFNRIVSNTGGSTGAIFTASGAVTAQNNWWGCNYGPGQTGANCPAAPNGASGAVNAAPRLVLNASASPATIAPGGQSTATADLTINSDGTNTFALGTLPNGASIAFAGSGGTFATPTAPTLGGRTTDVFTASSAGNLTLTASLDGQTAPFGLLVNTPPTVSQISAQTTNEDTAIGPIAFTIGDADGNPLTTTGVSSNPALIGSIVFGGSGNSRTVTITPVANMPSTAASASATITINVNDGFVTTPMSFLLTVNAVNDAPTLDAIANPAAISEDAAQQTINLSGIGAGGGENQTLTVTAASDNHALILDPAVSYTSANPTGSLTYTPVANAFGTATITVTVTDDGGTANGGVDTTTRTFTVTVSPVADTPSISDATTVEDVQTTSGLVVTLNPLDGAEVTHIKVTNVQHGSLFLNDGTTAVPSGSFVTVAQAAAGLRFTPAANFSGNACFDVQASTSNTDAGLGGGTAVATITVTAAADTPSVTAATTVAQVQTTSGLVITPNAVDGSEVTHFKITNIQHGTLFQTDGTTAIVDGQFITVTDGGAGLKFTPADGFTGGASFDVQASIGSTDAGLGGGVASAAITVNPHATTTTLTSASPDPSDQTQPITVAYSVASADSGPAPSPTSTVTVSISGGSETCSGTVAAGQCTLTPTIAGSRLITATYDGDAINAGSVSATLGHTVNACTVDPVVTSNADSGPGSLRQALLDACYGNTISFDMGSVASPIGLTSGELVLAKNIEIDGPGADVLTIRRAAGTFRLFSVNPGVGVTIGDLTLADGDATASPEGSGGGGAFYNNGGFLQIGGSELVGNTANWGGAIYNDDAVNPSITLLIANTLRGNVALHKGGAIFNQGGSGIGGVLLDTNTVSGNLAAADGGGLYSTGTGAVLLLSGNTITNNHADKDSNGRGVGGGVWSDPAAPPVVMFNSIVAGNFAGATDRDDISAALDPLAASFNLIGVDVNLTLDNDGTNHVGSIGSPLDPRLAPLAANGGTTMTHMPQPGSPALDAGDNDLAGALSCGCFDQRGPGFERIRAAAGTGVTLPNVDIGAVEADPTVEVISAKATNEDTPLAVDFAVADPATAFDSIVATSSDTALVPNLNLAVTGSGAARTLTITPAANAWGTATITVAATKTIAGTVLTSQTAFTLTVNSVNDPPTLDPISTPAAINEDAGQQTINLTGITAGPLETQILTVTAASNNTALIPNPAVTYTSPNATASLAYTPVANASGTATITVTVTDDLGLTAVRTFLVTVNAVADTPSFSGAATTEDTQTTSGLVLTRNAADGAEVTHYKITGISGGTLFQADGTTPIAPGAFITITQGAAGLRFTPSANSFVTGHVTAQASVGALDAGLGGSPVTADIVVTPIADTPLVTGATTTEDVQTTSGLVLSRNAADGAEVTHFKITAITNGSLFQHDGTTPIVNGQFITFAEGNLGLRFTPAVDFSGTGSFVVQAATSAVGDGLSPGTTASITVTAVADTPSITGASTVVNQQTTSGLVIARNAADGAEVTHVKVTAISGGTLFQHDGTTAIAGGTFITIAQGAAGLRFTPATNSVTTGHVSIQASTSNIDAGLGGGLATADIVVNPLTSTTTVVTSLSPSNPGQAVTFTATVTPTLAGASGTVQFQDGGVNLGAPVALAGGTAALTTSALTPGTHTITAVYSGNSLAFGSTGTLAGGQIIREPVTIALSASANPALLGDTITVTATTVHAGSGAPTGPILLHEGIVFFPLVYLSGGTAAIPVAGLAVGTHHLDADYPGDNAFAPSTASIDLVVTCPTMTIGPATIAPAVIGVPYSQTFTVTGVGPGTATFALTGTLPVGLTFNAATATLSGIALAPGSYPITIAVTRSNGCGAASKIYTLVVGGGRTILTGADAGGASQLRRFTALDGTDPTSGPTSFLAFDALFTGGARVAEGDVNGDGKPDFIAGSGPGRPAEVRVFDGASGALIRAITMFEPGFIGGVYVAAGDVDGDGFADIVAASGPGRAGEVRVYSGRTGGLLRDVNVFVGGFTGGVRVAAGDVTGDGLAEIIVATGPGASDVSVLSSVDLSVLRTLTPYPGFVGGVFVAAGDVNGDGFADVVTGADGGGSPLVRAFDGPTGTPIRALMAFDPAFTGGVRVAVGDVTGDGHGEIIAGRGPGGSADVRVFDAVTLAQLSAVSPYPVGFTGGVFVATAVPLSRMIIDAPTSVGSVRSNFTIAGWAFEEGVTGGGIAQIVGSAIPVGGGASVPLGAATLGDARPDVAAAYGAQYGTSGFHLSVTGLAPGTYDLRLTASGSTTGTANLTRTVRFTVRPDPVPLLSIDVPTGGPVAGGTFLLAGWALTPETVSPPGVDAVHVWAAPVTGGAWQFAGAATLGLPRPDVAAAFGSQYATAGYALTITGLPPGTWDLHVYPRETGKSSFAADRVVRVTVPGGPARSITTGADMGGGPHVRRLSALDGSPATGALNSFFAFDPSVTGGVRVAEGDLNGDGVPDYIIGAGPGSAPTVRVFDGASGTMRASFTAFEASFTGGVFVAAGDVNGDGYADVIVGSGQGRAGEIKVWSGRDLTLYGDMTVFDPAFTGGVRVAAGDVNGDGLADLIAGTGSGASLVTVINAANGSTLRTFTAYPGFGGGVYVAAGDVNGDGFADIVTGAGESGGPLVRAFDGKSGAELIAFYAFPTSFTGGVHVAAGDVTGDGRADIIAGSGPGGGEVRVFDGSTATLLNTMTPYSGFTGGVFVATAVPVSRMSIDLPAMNATVAQPFLLGGWAFEEGPTDAGIDAIHVWAMPVGGGAPIFAGVATLGGARPDVALVYGAQYAHAGYSVTLSGLPAGTYDLMLFAHGTKSGTFNLTRVVRVKVGS